MEIKKLSFFIELAKEKPRKKIVVAAAEDDNVLEAVFTAKKEGIIEPILIGNTEKINLIAKDLSLDLSGIEIISENNPSLACKKSVTLIKENKAQIIMKGMVSTADYLRAILDKDNGLRKNDLLSHIGFFELQTYHKVIALTDAAQNIEPTLQEKIYILNNALDIFHRLGISEPKIAVLSAVETVNPKIPATIDAAILTIMNKRKQIKGCIIDGPLAFDNAVSKEAAHHKGIQSEVAGDADLLFVPEINSGNILYKSMTYFSSATVAAVILGASAPVVLTSRADSEKSKLMSIALAASF